MQKEPESDLDRAGRELIEMANGLAERMPDADLWDLADGLMLGAVQYWLFSRKPCGDPGCTDCEPISTAGLRRAELLRMVAEMVDTSDYLHQPTDSDVGRA